MTESIKPQMTHYYGTRHILARPMTRGEYNTYRGWTIPGNEDPSDEGYLTESLDWTKPNHPCHEGHISWVRAGEFKAVYTPTPGAGLPLPQQQMMIEEFELNDKIIKLKDFITGPNFTVVVKDELERRDLLEQLTTMSQYHTILLRRISRF
jgi:hypothetical protein